MREGVVTMADVPPHDDVEKTHLADRLQTVGPYSFLMCVPKRESDQPLWFVYVHGSLARRESFDTLEDAMRYAARPTR